MAEQKLRRSLNLWECVFWGVGSILGAGIYVLIGKVIEEAGNMSWVAFAVAFVVAGLSAFSYAELSTAYPKSGGEYVYVQKTMGQGVGTAMGIMVTLTGIVSGATVALGFAEYFSSFLNVSYLITAPAIILVLFLVNITGIKFSSWINVVCTCIELAGLALVLYAARKNFGDVDYMEMPPAGVNGLLTGAALSFFAFIGFEKIVKLAEESKNPERDMPAALFISSGFTGIIYIAIALAVAGALHGKPAAGKTPLISIVSTEFGKTGAIALAVIALFSTANTILSDMLGSSRVILAIGEDVKFMKPLAYVSSKRKTPIVALLVMLFAMCGFAMIGDIRLVAEIANFSVFITFIFVNMALIIMRVKHPELKPAFRVPLNIRNIPVIPILGIALTAVMIGYTIYGLVK